MIRIEEYLEKAANEGKLKALIGLYSQYNSELRQRENLFKQIIKDNTLIQNEETINVLYEKLKSKDNESANKLLKTIDSIVEDTKEDYKKLSQKRMRLPEFTIDLILNTQEEYNQLILPLKKEDINDGFRIFGAIYEKYKENVTKYDPKAKEKLFNGYLSFILSKAIKCEDLSNLVNENPLLDTAKIKFNIRNYKLPEITLEPTQKRYIEITLPESITKKKPAWQRFGILPVDTKQCIKTSEPDLKLKDFFPKQGHKFIISDGREYEFETWQDNQGRINTGMTEFYRKNKVQSGSVLRLEEIEHHKKYALNIVTK